MMKKEIAALILLLPCALTDLKYRQIPVIFVAVFAAVIIGIRMSEPGFMPVRLLFGMAPGIFLAAVSFMTRGKAGMGDAVLVTALGVLYGFETTAGILITALFLTAVFGIGRRILKKDGGTELPFAPFLTAACIAARILFYLQGGKG